MTQINRDELIEKIAKAIHSENMNVGATWEKVKVKTQFLNQAEAALKAIGGYLPSGGGYYIATNLPRQIEPREAVFVGINEAELYTQFKNICEGK